MQGVDLGLQQLADILPNGVVDVETLGPARQSTAVDADLIDGEGEGEAQLKDLFAFDLRAGLMTLEVRFEVVVVVGSEEVLDLEGEEGEELFRGFGDHEFARDGDFGLGKGEGGIAV